MFYGFDAEWKNIIDWAIFSGVCRICEIIMDSPGEDFCCQSIRTRLASLWEEMAQVSDFDLDFDFDFDLALASVAYYQDGLFSTAWTKVRLITKFCKS